MNGQITCVEAVRHYLETITAQTHLNAWLEIFETEALQTAEKLDSERGNGRPIGQTSWCYRWS